MLIGALHSLSGESEILRIIDCGAQTSQVVVVPFELMAFPLASKETEVTGLSDISDDRSQPESWKGRDPCSQGHMLFPLVKVQQCDCSLATGNPP